MRFMVMHKVDAKMEAGDRPDDGIIERMGKLVGRSIKAGVFLDGAGLHRSATRARVTFGSGKPTVTRGPFTGANELVETMVLVSTTGIEHAIELATQLGSAAGQRDTEVGPVVEGWDLHGGTRPKNAPHRFLLLLKGDEGAQAPAVRALIDQWKREGLAQSDTTLAPSKTAVRSNVIDSKRRWMDGPFAESKELVAGFSVIDVATLDDARRWADEYADILGDNEVDIRGVVMA
jgi:hypothetical protein